MSSIQEDLLQQYHEKLEEQKADFENVKLKLHLKPEACQRVDKVFERYQTLIKNEQTRAAKEGSNYIMSIDVMKNDHAITNFMLKLQFKIMDKESYKENSSPKLKTNTRNKTNKKGGLWSRIKNSILATFKSKDSSSFAKKEKQKRSNQANTYRSK